MIQSAKMAVKSIGSSKMRAFLTMLGIIIGVMALVILVSLVNGSSRSVSDQISRLGSNLITVTISDNKGNPVSLEDLDTWTEEKAAGAAAAYAQESLTAKYGGTSETVSVYGTVPACYDIQGLELLLGRFLKRSDVENHTNICIINENTASELIGFTDCLGEVISLDGVRFTVAGVLKDDDQSLTGMFGSSSLVAYRPYTSLIRISDSVTSEVTSFYAAAADGKTVDETKTQLTEILLDRFEADEDAFEAESQDALEDTMGSVTNILTILLGGIAAISLIVGGIGIMNIMLVTVTERTREIGIRKAIGADRSVILQQFLMEAVILCMMGCVIGIFLSWCILQLITIVVSSLDMQFQMDGTVVLIAVGFCFVIGIIFGLYPANKAARMKPIDALHYDG